MDIQARLVKCEQTFEERKTSREQHLRQAEEDLTEMTKLQGEYRVLQDMVEDQAKNVNKEATTIKAVPEKEKT